MDTIIQPVNRPAKRRAYRTHTDEFKRAAVELTLVDGASVSLIAREHNVNTNQLFGWRKLYREGRLGNAPASDFKLLPVTITESSLAPSPQHRRDPGTACSGVIELEVGKARLRIEGSVNAAVLALVLERVLR